MSTFVFLEIKDPPAVQLLTSLRSTLMGRSSSSPIHITIQGPYKNTPTRAKLHSIWETIQGDGVLLHGIGKFQFGDRDVIYLKSHSRAIRKVWWKRDFPMIKFGFNPHITLYEGPPARAKIVQDFLKNQRIELYCRQFALSVYTNMRDDLFPQVSREVIYSSPVLNQNVLANPYRWKQGLEQAAERLDFRSA